MRSGFVSPIGHRNGAASPMTTRAGTSSAGAVSPINGASTPNLHFRSPLSASDEAQHIARHRSLTAQQLQMKAVARRQIQSLTLDTQMNGGRPNTGGSEDSEEFDEVISLSPAVRAPVKKFRRASSAMSMSAHPDGKNLVLDSIQEASDKTYFGQDVNPEDLVAVNLENAFDQL
jgi:hypothetical protein